MILATQYEQVAAALLRPGKPNGDTSDFNVSAAVQQYHSDGTQKKNLLPRAALEARPLWRDFVL
jgi:hypothetical protein